MIFANKYSQFFQFVLLSSFPKTIGFAKKFFGFKECSCREDSFLIDFRPDIFSFLGKDVFAKSNDNFDFTKISYIIMFLVQRFC